MSGGRRRLGLRRRLDASALRWRARLDTAWVDRTMPWAIGGALAFVLAAIGFALQRQLDGGPALAVWTQAAWNLERGSGATSSLAGGNLVTDQWAFTSLPLLWLGRWVPMGPMLAIVQPAFLGLAVVPIWRTARDVGKLRLGVSAALCLAYAAAPILYTANLNGWSAVVPAVPALAWASWFGQQRKWVGYGLCCAVALASRADVGLVLVALGALGVTSGDRRPGMVTGGVGAAWTAAYLALVAPTVPRGPMTSGQAVLARGEAPLAVLRDPLRLVTDLVLQPNVGALIVLVGPFLFLPLVVPRFAIPALPPIVLGLVGEEAVRQAVGPGPGPEVLPSVLMLAVGPLALASIVALARIGTPSVTRLRVDHRIVAAMVLATALFFIQVAPASPFNEPWAWGSQDNVDGGRMEAVDLLDAEVGEGSVSVSPQVAPLVAKRRVVVELGFGPPSTRWRPTTDAVLLDTTALDEDGTELWVDEDVAEALDVLTDQRFNVVYDAAGIYLLLREAA